MNAVADHSNTLEKSNSDKELLTMFIAGQQFGIPILQIQDVLGEQKVTKIPLSQAEVDGALNLRGRIVTAINVRKRLGMPPAETSRHMSVVVEHNNELYSLIIDRVGDVLNLQDQGFDRNLATLDPLWREVSMGIYRLEKDLLVVLDVPKLIDTVGAV